MLGWLAPLVGNDALGWRGTRLPTRTTPRLLADV